MRRLFDKDKKRLVRRSKYSGWVTRMVLMNLDPNCAEWDVFETDGLFSKFRAAYNLDYPATMFKTSHGAVVLIWFKWHKQRVC